VGFKKTGQIMSFKEEVYKVCWQRLAEKIEQLRNTLKDLKESASNETKSTAGDKHETALAMLQIEQENTNKQLENLLNQQLALKRIEASAKFLQVANGALVQTSKGYFFIGIALGKIIVGDVKVVVISPQSPLGNKLLHLKCNDNITVNGLEYTIEGIE
jgi:transcription elongation GreA/GreB family factor